MQCNVDVKETFLHRHLRIRHGLMRAGKEKVHRNDEQTPRYNTIRLKVTAENMANIFARVLLEEFDSVKSHLIAAGIRPDSMPLARLMAGHGYTMILESGEILLLYNFIHSFKPYMQLTLFFHL